jgi:hypothetical protein
MSVFKLRNSSFLGLTWGKVVKEAIDRGLSLHEAKELASLAFVKLTETSPVQRDRFNELNAKLRNP